MNRAVKDHIDKGYISKVEYRKINNKDRKVGQAITYAGEKQENEKIILLANTYREQAVSARPKESFTPQAIKIVVPFDVCLVTGVALHNYWKAIIEGRKTKDDVISILRQTTGVLEYKS